MFPIAVKTIDFGIDTIDTNGFVFAIKSIDFAIGTVNTKGFVFPVDIKTIVLAIVHSRLLSAFSEKNV